MNRLPSATPLQILDGTTCFGPLAARNWDIKACDWRLPRALEAGMSWNTSALVIEGDQVRRGSALFADLGFPGLAAVSQISGDEAGSSGLRGRALGLVSGWTLVWDPCMFLVPEESAGVFQGRIWSLRLETALLTLSQGARIYSFITQGITSTHGFAWYMQSQRKRLWVPQAGTVIMQDGEQLPEEVRARSEEPDEEQRLFVIMEKLTGISMHDALAQQFMLFA